jgi:hypothetical protein
MKTIVAVLLASAVFSVYVGIEAVRLVASILQMRLSTFSRTIPPTIDPSPKFCVKRRIDSRRTVRMRTFDAFGLCLVRPM